MRPPRGSTPTTGARSASRCCGRQAASRFVQFLHLLSQFCDSRGATRGSRNGEAGIQLAIPSPRGTEFGGFPVQIAAALQRYLDERSVDYELVEHAPSVTSKEAAGAAGVGEERIAKAVVLEDRKRFLAVMIPASRRVHFTMLHEHLGRHVGLATEDEVRLLFDDCAPGAVPGVPQAYGIEVLVDDALLAGDDVYFESGSRSDLVHVSGAAFRDLMAAAAHGAFSSRH